MLLNIKERIIPRMEKRGLKSISALEKEAGIKLGTVRNIFQGKSNNPSAETLLAIANTLECSIDELLGREEYSVKKHPAKTNVLSAPIQNDDQEWEPDLFNNISSLIQTLVKKKHIKINVEQAIFLIKEAYHYSIKKGRTDIDSDFVEWLLDKTV